MGLFDTTSSPKRRWLSFSLRGAFVLVTIVCVWLAVASSKARTQARFVNQVEKLRGFVVYDYSFDGQGAFILKAEPRAPQWLRSTFGEEYFRNVVAVDFRFGGDSIISDDDLEVFDDFGDLTELELSGNPDITDAGIRHLAGMNKLRSLSLQGTGVTGPGLQHLPRGLELLNLQRTPLTHEALGNLRGMTRLKILQLGNTATTDLGLANLFGLLSLEELDLRHTDITDAGLAHFAPLKNLKQLLIGGTNVTGPGVARLQQALPNCRFSPPAASLSAVPRDMAPWPAGRRPSKEEIFARVKALGGEASVNPSDPGGRSFP